MLDTESLPPGRAGRVLTAGAWGGFAYVVTYLSTLSLLGIVGSGFYDIGSIGDTPMQAVRVTALVVAGMQGPFYLGPLVGLQSVTTLTLAGTGFAALMLGYVGYRVALAAGGAELDRSAGARSGTTVAVGWVALNLIGLLELSRGQLGAIGLVFLLPAAVFAGVFGGLGGAVATR